ncbi:YjbH domain-containing protein, partial [Stenotrophomonas terrae]
MTHRNTRALMHVSVTLLCLGIAADLQAQQAPTPSSSDWGGIGLLQTPTARMAAEGELGITASHTSPYSRYTVTLQPLPW